MNEDPLVSVISLTYNHEKYLEQAIEGFLMQDTNFPFEVIIHDDRSTDKTAEIIKRYQEKYPDIIIGWLEEENQQSKGVKIIQDILLPSIRGKYIALCEGDDYWTDPKKLQIQFDYMESHPECMLVVHANAIVSESGKKKGCTFYSKKECDIPIEDLIRAIQGRTMTYFMRKELYYNFSSAKRIFPVGDRALAIEAAMKGTVHYIPRVMSVYRIFSSSSYSRRMRLDKKYRENDILRKRNYFVELKRVLPEKGDLIDEMINLNDFLYAVETQGLRALSLPYCKSLSIQKRLYYAAKCLNPQLSMLITSKIHELFPNFTRRAKKWVQ